MVSTGDFDIPDLPRPRSRRRSKTVYRRRISRPKSARRAGVFRLVRRSNNLYDDRTPTRGRVGLDALGKVQQHDVGPPSGGRRQAVQRQQADGTESCSHTIRFKPRFSAWRTLFRVIGLRLCERKSTALDARRMPYNLASSAGHSRLCEGMAVESWSNAFRS